MSAIPSVWRPPENDSRIATPYPSERDGRGSPSGLIRGSPDSLAEASAAVVFLAALLVVAFAPAAPADLPAEDFARGLPAEAPAPVDLALPPPRGGRAHAAGA